ncbi:MAG: NTP transferase domain-containing protein [Candidatus Bipolaricaulia bacterium]
MKAIILAAGKGKRASVPFPKVLQRLGGRYVIDYVVENALQFVDEADTYIVVGYQRHQVERYLGGAFHYVVQEELLGTGHAVLQTYPFLRDFDGDLLILNGDSPLFRAESLRRLIDRHRTEEAELTILTGVTNDPLPYGRIVRDPSGRIIDIIEDADAHGEIREIDELNAGAYLVRADRLFPALHKLDRDNAQGEYLLTDTVRALIRSGCRVEGVSTFDPDELLGVNTEEDLIQAERIVRKRGLGE